MLHQPVILSAAKDLCVFFVDTTLAGIRSLARIAELPEAKGNL